MREIEFRGKSLVTNNWVYGNYIIDKWGDSNNEIIYGILQDRTAPDYLKNWIPVRVNPNTVGQYTGLKDKNDKKVFEGDVIRMHYFFNNYDPISLGAFEDEAEIIGVVKCELLDGFYVETVDDHSICYLQWVEEPTEELEVLGNIYDNPELLEVE